MKEVNGVIIKREKWGKHYRIVARDKKGRIVTTAKWSSKAEKREIEYKKVEEKAKRKKGAPEVLDTYEVTVYVRKDYKAIPRPGKGDTRSRDNNFAATYSLLIPAKDLKNLDTYIEAIREKVTEQVYNYYAENFNFPLAEEMSHVTIGVEEPQKSNVTVDRAELELQDAEANHDYGIERYLGGVDL